MLLMALRELLLSARKELATFSKCQTSMRLLSFFLLSHIHSTGALALPLPAGITEKRNKQGRRK